MAFTDPRSSVSCAAVPLRARFTELACPGLACHGARSRASQHGPYGDDAAVYV